MQNPIEIRVSRHRLQRLLLIVLGAGMIAAISAAAVFAQPFSKPYAIGDRAGPQEIRTQLN